MNSRPQLVLTGAVMVAILTVVAAGCTGTAPTPVQGSTGDNRERVIGKSGHPYDLCRIQ